MNYDLIIKLAKLANNNPSENEANAAARKVCRLLAESNYQFNGHTNPQPPPRQRVYDEESDLKDIFSYFYGRDFRGGRRYGKSNPFAEGSWTTQPEPKNRVCSECGKERMTLNTDLYFKCDDCISRAQKRTYETRYKKKYEKHVHQCKCGARNWWYDEARVTWMCFSCKATVSIIEAAAKDWIMM